jgi:hypothetical protein
MILFAILAMQVTCRYSIKINFYTIPCRCTLVPQPWASALLLAQLMDQDHLTLCKVSNCYHHSIIIQWNM